MTERILLLGFAVVAFMLGVVALGLTARAAVRRGQAGQRQPWVGLIFQGVLVVVLFALGAASLLGASLTNAAVNRPSPAPSAAVVAFVPNTREGASTMIQAVSAQEGTTRWTRSLKYNVDSLLQPTPDIILAYQYPYGVCALRSKDGVVLWCHTSESAGAGPVATDGVRVYMVTSAFPPSWKEAEVDALDVQTGAVIWRTPFASDVIEMVVSGSGDGMLVMASATAPGTWEITALGAGDGRERWAKTAVAGAVTTNADQQLMVAGGNVIIQTGRGPLTALREQDGATVWSGPSSPTGTNPATMLNEATSDGAVVYVMSYASANASDASTMSSPARLMALEARSGAVLWSRAVHPYTHLRSVNTTPGMLTLSDGVLLNGIDFDTAGFGGFDPNGSLLSAYDTATGQLLWRDNTPPTGISLDQADEMTPLGGEGVVYLVGLQSPLYIHEPQLTCALLCPGITWLYAVNGHTGAPWWRTRTGYFNLFRLTI